MNILTEVEEMKVINNKYLTYYVNIVTNAFNDSHNRNDDDYYENHHYVPKSIIKNNNLVKLTLREHFICHRLLPKFLIGDHQKKMLFALRKMTTVKRYTATVKSSRVFEKLKKISCKHTEETKKLISLNTVNTHKGQIPWNKGMTMEDDWKEKRQKGADDYRANNPGWDKNWREAQRKAEPKRLKSISRQVSINGIAYPSAREAFRTINSIKYPTLIKRIESKNFPEYNWITT